MDITAKVWIMFSSTVVLGISVVALAIATFIVVRPSRPHKLPATVVGFLTTWTAAYCIVALPVWVTNNNSLYMDPEKASDSLLVFLYLFSLFGRFTVFLTYMLMAYYFSQLKQSTSLKKKERWLYGVGFVLFPFIFMPIYFLKFIKRDTA
jgi:hypothetical protein